MIANKVSVKTQNTQKTSLEREHCIPNNLKYHLTETKASVRARWKVVNRNSEWAFKVGLFFVALVWFSFTAYQLGRALVNGVDVPYTDIPGGIGLGLRTAAAFVALVTILFFLAKRDLSPVEVVNTFRWLVLFEAGYFVLFLPAAVWGLQYSSILYSREFFIIEAGLPCLLKATILPTVLVVLFFKLKPNQPAQEAIKWGLIAASASIFALWFDYTAQWWSEIFLQGTGFLSQYPIYAFEFALTAAGLLFLAVYVGIYTKDSSEEKTLAGLNLKKAGLVITALGLYFDIIWLLWLLFGDVSAGRLTVWPTFSVDHNIDLWMATLPLVGVPLLFAKDRNKRK